MSDTVWISDMMADSEVSLTVTNDVSENNLDRFIEGEKLLRKGMPVPPDCCPNRIWGNADIVNDQEPVAHFPDLFGANGQYIISERAANILRQFDLGDGALYPVSEGVYHDDNQTRFPGEFFTWIFGNVKTAFLPDETERKDPFGVAGLRWTMPTLMQDNDIAVSRAALDGPDVWMESNLMRSVFLSGPLGQALSDAGLGKAFRLKTCRVI